MTFCFFTIINMKGVGKGYVREDEIIKLLVVQALGPYLDPEHSYKKLKVVTCASNPSSRKAEAGGVLELTGQTL